MIRSVSQLPAMLWALGLSIILSITLAPASVHADTIVQNFVVPAADLLGPTDQNLLNQPITVFSFNVNQFDPALGTLDSADVSFNASLLITGTAGPTGGSISGGASTSVYFDGTSFTGAGSGTGSGGGPGSPVSAPFSLSGSSGLVSGILPSAIGTGTVVLEMSSLTGGNLDGSTLGTDTALLSVTGGNVAVTYNYTAAIPEPASALLLLSAIAPLIGLPNRRRRRIGPTSSVLQVTL